jgi:hypothetical protein
MSNRIEPKPSPAIIPTVHKKSACSKKSFAGLYLLVPMLLVDPIPVFLGNLFQQISRKIEDGNDKHKQHNYKHQEFFEADSRI